VVEWATSSNDPDVLGVDKYNVFVGGLNPLLVTKAALEERFGAYGQVDAVTLINRDEAQENSMGATFTRNARHTQHATRTNEMTRHVCAFDSLSIPQRSREMHLPSSDSDTPRRLRRPSSMRCACGLGPLLPVMNKHNVL
jgi:hypothetical protein